MTSNPNARITCQSLSQSSWHQLLWGKFSHAKLRVSKLTLFRPVHTEIYLPISAIPKMNHLLIWYHLAFWFQHCYPRCSKSCGMIESNRFNTFNTVISISDESTMIRESVAETTLGKVALWHGILSADLERNGSRRSGLRTADLLLPVDFDRLNCSSIDSAGPYWFRSIYVESAGIVMIRLAISW
jgi:hypothetical protein